MLILNDCIILKIEQLFEYRVTKYYLSTRNKNAIWTDLKVLLCLEVCFPFIVLNSHETA